ncbi:MBL fold metallo-hydrolase, partial [Candidatus Falkowbacteria bacterium]|nr:MBL fold metallo-hydrolase [Candidatus Falkowbacteria bacterium]
MKLTFFGGAKTVTGANYLLQVGQDKVLIDCGLFQGSSELEFLNSDAWGFDPKEISHVFVTHSHQDHCGRIPRLVNEGFKGKIIATKPGVEMMLLALLDAANISLHESQESGFPPLFKEEDVYSAQRLMKGVDYGQVIKVSPRISVEVLNAGHILGSAMYRFTLKEGKKKKVITFTGDLGNHPAPLLPKHSPIESTDILVMESAYGNRNHESPIERKEMLKKTILDCVIAKGTLLIPSFAIERTQVLLYEINEMVEKREIPRLPIYIDSPLATKMTKVYRKYLRNKIYFNTRVHGFTDKGDDIFNFPGLEFVESTKGSKALNQKRGPKIIIAGSGMSTAGRILFHEQLYLPDPKNFILFVG